MNSYVKIIKITLIIKLIVNTHFICMWHTLGAYLAGCILDGKNYKIICSQDDLLMIEKKI